MSDPIGHECGLALVRPKQPLHVINERFGDAAWGLRRLHLLMEKQRNRGQDGAGIATVKFGMPPGEPFFRRIRTTKRNPLERLFDAATRDLNRLQEVSMNWENENQFKSRCEFLGEVYLGHLRYGTHSGRGVTNCHPLLRKDNTASRNLAVAGNFNMTNSDQLFHQLVEYGLNPVGDSDTQVILERLGYFLDLEHRQLRTAMGPGSFLGLEGRELAEAISQDLDIVRVLRRASEGWDGGYLFGGLLGNGDAFVCRDPSGIRPGFWIETEDVVAVASERPPLSTVFDLPPDDVHQVPPGHVLVIKRDGTTFVDRFTDPMPERQCTFERIYFSRGNDPDIYRERKELGCHLARRVLDMIDWQVKSTVFSFVPNTAETSYLGLIEEAQRLVRARQVEAVWDHIQQGTAQRKELEQLQMDQVRSERVAHKDQRLRTFITHDAARRDLVMHIYDIVREIVTPQDTLVMIDDSIVRGTTLRESIITILGRLNPARIIIVSSAPPICYPDCYGIDMSQLDRFVAFQAAVALVEESDHPNLLEEIEADCAAQVDLPPERMKNHVARLYEPFSQQQIESKIAELVRPSDSNWSGRLDIVYQSIDGLRKAMPAFRGDWYFTGDYPTPGGLKVLNRAYLNWRKGLDERAY
ncbi:MAG: amidophosphoribosyltransferase [Planctomycetota bacterium]|nr:amidophosphoribosyltransferase [Planctomycetota bacterium]